ncbi:hypothetical protein IFM89_010702 [Coptis chinensis]|uniref:Uncharacterized protein n=1 Tax=Coptis chinensis TaxID=261450 RepID=A0A835IP02_9MAGN|nr:hypothetical protein IFM89_010702 [Coptis chinensis]
MYNVCPVYRIWIEWNARRFRSRYKSALEVQQKILKNMKYYFQCQIKEAQDIVNSRVFLHNFGIHAVFKGKEGTKCKWFKPPEGSVKLNTGRVVDLCLLKELGLVPL